MYLRIFFTKYLVFPYIFPLHILARNFISFLTRSAKHLRCTDSKRRPGEASLRQSGPCTYKLYYNRIELKTIYGQQPNRVNAHWRCTDSKRRPGEASLRQSGPCTYKLYHNRIELTTIFRAF